MNDSVFFTLIHILKKKNKRMQIYNLLLTLKMKKKVFKIKKKKRSLETII